MKKFREKMSERAGFTLVELIVVIAILGILAGAAVAGYSGYINKAKDAADTEILTAVKTAASAALAEEGAVTEIAVDNTGKTVTAKAGGKVYTLMGSGVTGDSATDFKDFMAGNLGTGNDTVTLTGKFAGKGTTFIGGEWGNYTALTADSTDET